jgi:hypothetical protein
MVQIVCAIASGRGISEQVINPLKEHPHDNESNGNGRKERAAEDLRGFTQSRGHKPALSIFRRLHSREGEIASSPAAQRKLTLAALSGVSDSAPTGQSSRRWTARD